MGLYKVEILLMSRNKRWQYGSSILPIVTNQGVQGSSPWGSAKNTIDEFFEIIVTSQEEYRVGTIKKLYMRTLHYGCRGGGSNPSYFAKIYHKRHIQVTHYAEFVQIWEHWD